MSKSATKMIDQAFEQEDWKAARKVLKKELADAPDNHWLLTRLAMTYYEEHQYQKALQYNQLALQIAPKCPLARWDHACIMDMLNESDAAIAEWERILKNGLDAAANEPCGEGRKWARSLLNDCRYRIALASADLGRYSMSVKYLRQYLAKLKSGVSSIYEKHDACEMLGVYLHAK